MWKRLSAAIVGLGLAAGSAHAQDPQPPTAPTATAAALPAGGDLAPADPFATRRFDFGPCAACSPAPWRVWGSAELLLGTTRGVHVAPLVTTGPAELGFGNAGTLRNPQTVVLFGGRKMLNDWRTGVRAELGAWLDEDQVWGAAARFYSLFSTSEQLVASGNGANVINIPGFQLFRGSIPFETATYAGFPGVPNGSVSTTAQTNFAGGDLSLRRLLHRGSWWRIDALVGYRQLHLGDEVGIGMVIGEGGERILPPFLTPAFTSSLSVRTRNNFYGGQLGLTGSATWRRWELEGYGAAALGVNASDLNSDRSSQLLSGDFGVPPFAASDADRTDYFGTVAEGGARVAFRVTDHVRLTFGYTAIYWWNLRRAEELYAPTKQVQFRPRLTTDFFAHFLSWGAEFRY